MQSQHHSQHCSLTLHGIALVLPIAAYATKKPVAKKRLRRQRSTKSRSIRRKISP